MLKLQNKIESLWKNLNVQKINFQFVPTKFVFNKSEINVKILSLLNEKAKIVNQLSGFGFIILNQTILNSRSKISVSEQGIVSNDFFKARIIDIDSTIISGVYFHLVKVISEIISINPDHELLVSADEEFCQALSNNKLATKLFLNFLQYLLKRPVNLFEKIKVNIDSQVFILKFSAVLKIEKSLIFQARDLINQFLAGKKDDDQNYDFLKNTLTKAEKNSIS